MQWWCRRGKYLGEFDSTILEFFRFQDFQQSLREWFYSKQNFVSLENGWPFTVTHLALIHKCYHRVKMLTMNENVQATVLNYSDYTTAVL